MNNKPWIYIVWTYERVIGEPWGACVLWKKRGSAADLEAAQRHAATLDSGYVVLGNARTDMKALKRRHEKQYPLAAEGLLRLGGLQ